MIFDKLCKFSESILNGNFRYTLDQPKISKEKRIIHNNFHALLNDSKLFLINWNSMNEKNSQISEEEEKQLDLLFPQNPLPFKEGSCFCVDDQTIIFLYDKSQHMSNKDLIELKDKAIQSSHDADKLKHSNSQNYCTNFSVLGGVIFSKTIDKEFYLFGHLNLIYILDDSDNSVCSVLQWSSMGTTNIEERTYRENDLSGAIDSCWSNEKLAEIVNTISGYVMMANTALSFINHPKKFIFETKDVSMTDKVSKLKNRRSHQRPTYTVISPLEIRNIMNVTADTGRIVSAHERRRHPRWFKSDRFVNVKGQVIWVESTWIGPSEQTVGNKHYKVLLDK